MDPRRMACFLGALTLLIGATASAQEGFDIQGKELVIGERKHWETWQVPGHMVVIDDSGGIRTKDFRLVYNLFDDPFFRREVSLSSNKPRVMNLDSVQAVDVKGDFKVTLSGDPVYDYFLKPGPSRAGSNPDLVANLLDGDPTTYWEPDPADPLIDWWVEVSVGRTVPIERIRAEFVDAELGDPFRRFLLFLEDDQFPLVADDSNFQFKAVEPLSSINEDQRVVVVESAHTSGLLPPASEGLVEATMTLPNGSPSWNGLLVETIRLQVTDTKGARAEEISEERYLILPASERGEVEYFAMSEGGRFEPVDSTTYFGLAEERRGTPRYFRRELPRLAEIDAWGWGDNVAFDMLSNGGVILQEFPSGGGSAAFDGIMSSFYQNTYWDEEAPASNMLIADLGATIWAKEFRVLSQGYFQAPSIRGYLLRGSAGERDSEGRLKFARISSPQREINSSVGFHTELADPVDPPRKVRFMEFRGLENDPGGTVTISRTPGVGEFMAFSDGPPAEVTLTSRAMELPEGANLVAIDWEADTPPGTSLELRTRTGDEVEREIRFYNSGGSQVTEKKYNALLFTLKGPIDTVSVIGSDWSEWSEAYTQSGAVITSPSLRRFVQVQARLKADQGADPPALNRVSMAFDDPSVQGLIGEIWPQDAALGRLDTFEVFVRAGVVEQPNPSAGYDEVRLVADPGLHMTLIDVALGTEAEFAAGEPHRLFDRRVADGLATADGEILSVLSDRGDSMHVRLPELLVEGVGEGARLYFRRLQAGDETPTTGGGKLLNEPTYELLPDEEKGSIRFFRYIDAEQRTREEVGAEEYDALAREERAPIRYFRTVKSVISETVFSERGDTLSAAEYAVLPAVDQGRVVGATRLLRMRFAAEVFLHGTRLNLAARNGVRGLSFQAGVGGEATGLSPGSGLVLGALGAATVVADMVVVPNPFTPNGDGINERTSVGFSLFRLFDPRPVRIRVFSLEGRQVRRLEQQLFGGRHNVQWDGRDEEGNLVVPGLYIVQVDAAADHQGLSGTQQCRVVGVVY